MAFAIGFVVLGLIGFCILAAIGSLVGFVVHCTFSAIWFVVTGILIFIIGIGKVFSNFFSLFKFKKVTS